MTAEEETDAIPTMLSRFKYCGFRLCTRDDRRILSLSQRICADIGFPISGGTDQVVDSHNGLEE
jgi:hypothetical protein